MAIKQTVERFDEVLAPKFLEWLPKQRWFRSKGKTISKLRLYDFAAVPEPNAEWYLYLLEVSFVGQNPSQSEIYFVPVPATGEPTDALEDSRFGKWLLDSICDQKDLPLKAGSISFHMTDRFPDTLRALSDKNIHRMRVEQSNTSVVFGDQMILKVMRKIESGESPESEMLSFLTERKCDFIPALYAVIRYEWETEGVASLALGQSFVANQGDGWSYVLKVLESVYERTLSGNASESEWSDVFQKELEPHLLRVAELGKTTAQLHLNLASDSIVSNFKPEVISWDDVQNWIKRYHELLNQVLYAVKKNITDLEQGRTPLTAVLESEFLLKNKVKDLGLLAEERVEKIRYHGDFHLGQILDASGRFIIFDFEGEPLRTLEERKMKHSPLRDVAGMLRSFDYAAHVSAEQYLKKHQKHGKQAVRLSELWEDRVREIFLEHYLNECLSGRARFVTESKEKTLRLISVFELEKAIYELYYELNNRPDWVAVPAQGIHRILHREPSSDF